MKVKLLYFKAWGGGQKGLGGKYYSEGEYESKHKYYFNVVDEVRKMMEARRLPGLREGHSDCYHVLITTDPESVPHLLVAEHFVNPRAQTGVDCDL